MLKEKKVIILKYCKNWLYLLKYFQNHSIFSFNVAVVHAL